MYKVESSKKCDFVYIFESFCNSIPFWRHRFSLNFRKLLILSVFIFFLVNWTYVPCWIEQKVWFCRSFCIFFWVLELYSFLASQIFSKLQKIVDSINIYISSGKLDLCATYNQTKIVIFSIFMNFSLLFGVLFFFGLADFQWILESY